MFITLKLHWFRAIFFVGFFSPIVEKNSTLKMRWPPHTFEFFFRAKKKKLKVTKGSFWQMRTFGKTKRRTNQKKV